MLGIELDEDLAIGGADRGGFDPRLVDGAGRADVFDDELQLIFRNDRADLVLDICHDLCGVLDSSTAGDADEKTDQAGVGLGEKLATGIQGGENPECGSGDDWGQDEDFPREDEAKDVTLDHCNLVHAVLDGVVDAEESAAFLAAAVLLCPEFGRQDHGGKRGDQGTG